MHELKGSLMKISPSITRPEVSFHHRDYRSWTPHNMLIYCDPPYKGTTMYSMGGFDSDEFWETMKKWSKNNYVFVSEESAPPGFKVVFSRDKLRTVGRKSRFNARENLYIYSRTPTRRRKRKSVRLSTRKLK